MTAKGAERNDNARKSKKRKHSVVLHQNEISEKDGSVYDFPPSDDPENDKSGPPSKKRRSDLKQETLDVNEAESLKVNELETSKPSALFKPRAGRKWTLSMAVAGSIIANVMKPDHKTLLAGRIARAAAVFCVDEIVVFDDDPTNIPNYIDPYYKKGKKTKSQVLDSVAENDEPWQNPDQFLYHVLSYAECPPHLRMDRENPSVSLFPHHQNLQWAGQLPSLDMPHHMKSHEWCRYREGVTLGPAADAKTTTKSKKAQGKAKESWTHVKCGLPYPVKIPNEVPPSMRITLKFTNPEQPPSWPNLSEQECENLLVEAVAPSAPREEEGFYWGYQVRRAPSLSAVFTSSEFQDGYDVSIGTSERGAPLNAVLPDDLAPKAIRKLHNTTVAQIPAEFNHLLIVFGGVAGLEPAIATDPEFSKAGLTKETAHEAFDAWVNLVQGQGSRTIRTEEAVEFGLYGIKGYVDSMYERHT